MNILPTQATYVNPQKDNCTENGTQELNTQTHVIVNIIAAYPFLLNSFPQSDSQIVRGEIGLK